MFSAKHLPKLSRRAFLKAMGLTLVGLRLDTKLAHAQSFQVQWSVSFDSEVGVPTLDTGGTIYVPSRDGTLHAITPGGSVQWSFRPSGGGYIDIVRQWPVVSPNGLIYIRIGDSLIGVTPKGSEQTRLAGGSPPAIGSDGTLYNTESQYSCPSCPGYSAGGIIARTDSGSTIWRQPVPFSSGESGWWATSLYSPVIDGSGNIYAAFGQETDRHEHRLGLAMSVSSGGSLRWARNFGRYFRERDFAVPLSFGSGSLYINDVDGLSWISSGGSVSGPLLQWLVSGEVLVGSDGILYAYVRERSGRERSGVASFSSSGDLRWFNTDLGLSALILATNGTLYAISISPFLGVALRITALKASDGAVLRSLDLNANPNFLGGNGGSAVLSSTGTLYVTGKKGDRGVLFAVNVGNSPASGWAMFRGNVQRSGRPT